jgi:hypothetical protein
MRIHAKRLLPFLFAGLVLMLAGGPLLTPAFADGPAITVIPETRVISGTVYKAQSFSFTLKNTGDAACRIKDLDFDESVPEEIAAKIADISITNLTGGTAYTVGPGETLKVDAVIKIASGEKISGTYNLTARMELLGEGDTMSSLEVPVSIFAQASSATKGPQIVEFSPINPSARAGRALPSITLKISNPEQLDFEISMDNANFYFEDGKRSISFSGTRDTDSDGYQKVVLGSSTESRIYVSPSAAEGPASVGFSLTYVDADGEEATSHQSIPATVRESPDAARRPLISSSGRTITGRPQSWRAPFSRWR